MTVVPPSAPGLQAPGRGRGFVISGSVLLVLSVVAGTIGFVLTLGRVDFADFNRDVVIQGRSQETVPGRLPFSVAESLRDGVSPDMSVGVAVTPGASPQPRCTVMTVAGEEIPLSTVLYDTALYGDRSEEFEVIGAARLSPGDYEASCSLAGEPSVRGAGVEFTVGRTFGSEEFGSVVAPVLGFLAVLVVSGLMFLVGTVLLIVGLVQRSRSGRPPTASPPATPVPTPPLPGVPPSTPPGYPPSGPPVYDPPGPPSGPPVYDPPGPSSAPDSGWPTPPGVN